MKSDYPEAFLELLNSVKNKRPRTVIQHLLKHGFITSHELRDVYGYNHPARAIRDVRELGIPIETFKIKGSDGRGIAEYKFGSPAAVQNVLAKTSGRTALSKALKQALIEKYGSKCFVYAESMDENTLQVDHRIPYEIAGEQDASSIDTFMLLSPSANRAKSWTCEHCANWTRKDSHFCVKCFWASPEDYEHIAGKQQRVISIVYSDDEIEDYEKLIALSGLEEAQAVIKKLIKNHLL